MSHDRKKKSIVIAVQFIIILILSLSCSSNTVRTGSTESTDNESPAPVNHVMEFHRSAWQDAAEKSIADSLYRYSVYSSRSLAVYHPEIYLQADTIWMDMIMQHAGWKTNYLARDRSITGDEWLTNILLPVNDGLLTGTKQNAFSWDDFNWTEHRENAVDIFELYEGSETLDWVDNRLIFIWSAMKGLDWRMPGTSLAEAQYLQLLSEGKSVYLVITEDRKGYVAEVSANNVTVFDSVSGEPVESIGGNVVLIMNNDYVWYPLMARDDSRQDDGLSKVVELYAVDNQVPVVSVFEDSIIDNLRGGTRLETEKDIAWAKLAAIRALNQNTWRSTPLRNLSAVVLPDRYNECNGPSDSPQEQQIMGVMVTEMGNRLSPVTAKWADIVREYASTPGRAFAELGKTYLEMFHRIDNYSEWVFGDYYRCWFPNVDDKLMSGLSDCIVDATNVMSALYLASPDGWDIFETNWWSLPEGGGHVICGAYTPDGNYSLSNGLFHQQDASVLHGPLWNIEERVAYNLIYSPEKGFVVFNQTGHAFTRFSNPYTNMNFDEMIDFLHHLKEIEATTLISQGEGSQKYWNLDEYIQVLSGKENSWDYVDREGE